MYIIQKEDINKYLLSVISRDSERDTIDFCNIIGYVQKRDIGKKVVRTEKGNWQCENDDQFAKRLSLT